MFLSSKCEINLKFSNKCVANEKEILVKFFETLKSKNRA